MHKVWLSEFSFLKFRQMRQHPECSTCVRHKCLIRGLGHHIHARVKQEEMYQEHLHAQYLDRIQYWSTRGLSRSCSGELCVILDGMDQGKFAFPRHPSMHSKEFAGFTRPRAHVIGAIVHGRSIIYAITEPDLPKNATTHIEFLAYILTLVSEQEDLATLALRLQCDNTSRECKNNIMLAFLISMVSKGTLIFEGSSFCFSVCFWCCSVVTCQTQVSGNLFAIIIIRPSWPLGVKVMIRRCSWSLYTVMKKDRQTYSCERFWKLKLGLNNLIQRGLQSEATRLY